MSMKYSFRNVFDYVACRGYAGASLMTAVVLLLPTLGFQTVNADTIPFVDKETGVFATGKLESFLSAGGINNVPTDDMPDQLGMGWMRHTVSWMDHTPAKGVYELDDVAQFVEQANSKGLKVLLMFRNTPDWARETNPYSFEYLSDTWQITPTTDPDTGFGTGYWINRVDTLTGEPSIRYPDDPELLDTGIQMRARNPQDFVDFVDQVVGRFSVEPYNVKIFQIGNEHRPGINGYPQDGGSEIAERFFVPAGELIHSKYPGVRIMPGWPTNAEDELIEDFESVPGALEHMDMFAQHYGTPHRWPKVWERYKNKGVEHMGFWATEYGSVTTDRDPWAYGHDIPEIMGHALDRAWYDNDLDKYKAIWWPYAGNAAAPKSLVTNFGLTPHGEQMRTIHSLLYGEIFKLYSDYTAQPDPGDTDYIRAFQTDRGVVFSVGIDAWSVITNSTITLDLPGITPDQITLARSVDPLGNIVESLSPVASADGSSLVVDLSLLVDDPRNFFVEIHAAVSDTVAPDVPGNLVASGGNGAIDLDWDDNNSSDLASYNVYRSTAAGGPYGAPIASIGVGVGSSNYQDTTVSGGVTYFYVTTAVDNVGNESAVSAEASTALVGDGGPSLHVGVVSNVNSGTWSTVVLPGSYNSMVVVATANYDVDTTPAVVRIRNAVGNSFEVTVDNTDGTTAINALDVHYMVLEEGVYNVSEHGVAMEAVKYNSSLTDFKGSLNGERRSYSNVYTSPVVFGQVMTYNDPDFSLFWSHGRRTSRAADADDLFVGKHVGEDPDKTRLDEIIGYVVIESGVGAIDGTGYTAALGADSVRGISRRPSTYTLSGISSASVAIANQAGAEGRDGSWALLFGVDPVSSTALNLAVDEDIAGDAERRHTSVTVGYIVFE